MYACICYAVTDDQVCTAIDQGATTIEAVGSATDAGTGCGTCHDRLDGLISERCPVAYLTRLEVA